MTNLRLPVELWRAVLEELVDDPLALARVCLASKSFLSIAQPILYRHLRLGVSRTLLDYYVQCRRHLDSFRANPRLGRLVRSLRFVENGLSDGRHLEVRLLGAVGQLFELLPSLDIVLIERVFTWRDIDTAVARYQDTSIPHWNDAATRRRPTVFRLELPEDDIIYTMSCKGAYEECTYRVTNNYQAESFVPATFLSKSFPTLRALSVPLGERIDLSPFRALERLSLQLTIPSARAIATLVRVVPAVGTLKSLHLGSIVFLDDLTDLIARGGIVDCIGPNVVFISLEYPVFLDELLSFARSIPFANRLRTRPPKRFSCLAVQPETSLGTWSDDVGKEYEKKKTSIVDEFSKKGIELRFDASRGFE
ncbi:hypothetical protein JCM3766R1_001545 [Sporobolomyces carnicolor]